MAKSTSKSKSESAASEALPVDMVARLAASAAPPAAPPPSTPIPPVGGDEDPPRSSRLWRAAGYLPSRRWCAVAGIVAMAFVAGTLVAADRVRVSPVASDWWTKHVCGPLPVGGAPEPAAATVPAVNHVMASMPSLPSLRPADLLPANAKPRLADPAPAGAADLSVFEQ